MMMKFYRFRVSGTGRFPIDMLRHDGLSPHCEQDSAKIIATVNRESDGEIEGEIEVSGWHGNNWRPTYGRWESFGWRVVPGSEWQR